MSRMNIRTKEKRFPVAPDLYGLFFEDISRAGDGGLPDAGRLRHKRRRKDLCISHGLD